MDNIRQLSMREQSREKLPVFYGSYDNYYHGFRELLNNACDEILNHFDKGEIEVILSDDNREITVKDTGRGIPINVYENAKLLFETLFASGKYDVNEKTNSGVNGVGNTILQYSSKYFRCLSNIQSIGKAYEIVYKNGGEITKPLTCLGETDKHGTEITFRLDETVYTEVVFDEKEIENIIRRVSVISENIKFKFIYKNQVIEFQNTIYDYFYNYSENILGDIYNCSQKRFERDIEVERQGTKDKVKEIADIEVVFGTCTGENPLQETMLNGNYLKDRGTIFDGIIEGFKSYIGKYAKQNNLYKKNEKGLSYQDIENAISFVCRLFNNLVEFESQVKFSTKKIYYKEIAKQYIIEQLEVYKSEHEKDFKRMVEQILICKRANEVNIKARQKLKEKLTKKVDGINEVVDGFVDCELEKGGELFLVEGKSANGSIVLARDSYFQASYPLRGKLLNLLKAKWKDILDNNEITDIIQLLGCGVEVRNKYTKDLPKFNEDNLRFNKIILTADADSDGHQINTLILVAIYVLFPTLIEKGYVYISQPPIFQIDCGNIRKYAMSVREKDEIVKTLDGNVIVHRLKGLGETSAEVMAETVCNPETRILQQVKVSDIKKMKEMFDVWMNEDVSERKEYITNNLNRYLIDPPILDVVSEKNVENIVQDNMMDYSSDIIFDRALVSIESGIKPSQLRTLYAMYRNNITKLTKSQNVTGLITQYHPHGSAYSAVVNMCQEDRHLNPLIDYEGNMGQHTSKALSAASERYTNIKLSKLALDGLKEIDSHYVEMIDTYDNKRKMPLYLPNKYPLVLTQSTEGMAVGMASKLPSFNLNEVNNAIIEYLTNGKKTTLIPDFATGGKILNNPNTIDSINKIGKGSIRLRGKFEVVEDSIIFNEIPYGVRREDVINKAIVAIKNGKLKECINVKDLTDLKGMKIKFVFKKNTNMESAVAKLFKLTPLEASFNCNMNVLYNGLPSAYGVWGIIDKWLTFRRSCLRNGIDYQINKIEKELHKLYGFKKIVSDIDKVIEIIRFSEDVRKELKNTFSLDDIQSEYIEKTQLINLNEIKIKEQIKDIEDLINKKDKLIKDKNNIGYLNEQIVNELKQINKQYQTPRRTEIVDNFEIDTKDKELLVEDYNCVCYLTKEGYFKKVKAISNKGNNKLKDGDEVKTVLECNNKDELLVFGSDLCCYKFKLYELEETKLSNLGLYLNKMINCEVLGISVLNDSNKFITVIYKNNKIAKVDLKSFETKQNRNKLAKSLNNNEVFDILTFEDTDKQLKLTVTDSREKIINLNEMITKSSRSTQGINVYTWKNQDIVKVEVIDQI